jgi:hypothetical protein
MKKTKNNIPFSAYQKGVIALLAFLQFTIVLDFMVMAPLGDLLMKTLPNLLLLFPPMHLALVSQDWLQRALLINMTAKNYCFFSM